MSRSRSNYKVNIQDSSYTSHECVNFHDFVCQPCIFEGFQLTMENSRFSMKGNFVERCPIPFVLVDVRFNIRRWGETGLHVGSAYLQQLYRLARYQGCRRGPVASKGKYRSLMLRVTLGIYKLKFKLFLDDVTCVKLPLVLMKTVAPVTTMATKHATNIGQPSASDKYVCPEIFKGAYSFQETIRRIWK